MRASTRRFRKMSGRSQVPSAVTAQTMSVASTHVVNPLIWMPLGNRLATLVVWAVTALGTWLLPLIFLKRRVDARNSS